MNLLLAALLSLLLALAGAGLGWWFARLRTPYWLIGYLLPIGLVLLYAAAHCFPAVMFAPPASWLTMGPKKFALFGAAAATLLTTPLSRLRGRRARILVCILLTLIVAYMSVWSFLAPLCNRRELAQLPTFMDRQHICIQQTNYTCGPAAAALRPVRTQMALCRHRAQTSTRRAMKTQRKTKRV
jgi:hypothetical protein